MKKLLFVLVSLVLICIGLNSGRIKAESEDNVFCVTEITGSGYVRVADYESDVSSGTVTQINGPGDCKSGYCDQYYYF